MGTVNFLLYEFFHHTLEIQGEGILFHTTTAVNRNLFYYQNPLLIVQSISYFLIFSMFHFKSKIINHISCNIFAVYLITEHNQIIGFLYDKWLVNGIHSLALLPVWKIFVYALMVMIISIIIEELRKIIIKIFVFLSKIFIKICKN